MEERAWFKHWPRGVRRSLEYPQTSLDNLLREAWGRYPNRPAIVFNGQTTTYRQLNSLVDAFAAALQRLDVRRGDRVSLVMHNCPAAVVAYFGIWRAGAIVVQTDPMHSVSELEGLLNDTGATTAVALEAQLKLVLAAKPATQLRNVIVSNPKRWLALAEVVSDSFGGKAVVTNVGPTGVAIPHEPWVHDFEEMTLGKTESPANVGLTQDDLAVLQYTGGTTGTPKCAMLTHRNLLANACQTAAWLPDARPGNEVFVSVIPFSHSYGLTTALLTPIRLGSALVMQLSFGGIEGILGLIEEARATVFPGVPSMFAAAVWKPAARKHDIRSIRICISGSAPLPPEIRKRFEELTGVHLVEGYGLSEASPVTHCNPLFGLAKDGIGIPYPDTDAKIVDEETGMTDVPPGEAGELAVKGPQVMKGYWNHPEETALVMRGEWLLTGDIATMDGDGYFHIVDRKKDMLICSGYKVYPREVERVISGHPAVEECAVIGVPDELRGTIAKAYIVLRQGSENGAKEVVEFCNRHLATWKKPMGYTFVKAFPKTSAGKVLKRALREMAMQDGLGPRTRA